MVNKEQLYKHCLELVRIKTADIQSAIRAAEESSEGETKSSAGDKYETAREMMKQELDRLGRQLREAQLLEQRLQKIDPHKVFEEVRQGSLVQTDAGSYYLAVALGKINLEGQEIVVLSPEAPMARLLLGRKKGDVLSWNDKKMKLLRIG